MSFQILLKIIATNGHRHKRNVKKKENLLYSKLSGGGGGGLALKEDNRTIKPAFHRGRSAV